MKGLGALGLGSCPLTGRGVLRILRAPSTLTVVSDGSGPISMEGIGIKDGDGKVKRVKMLSEEQKQQIQAQCNVD